jgi:hypothetical protein
VDRGLPNDVLEPQEYSKFAENKEKEYGISGRKKQYTNSD